MFTHRTRMISVFIIAMILMGFSTPAGWTQAEKRHEAVLQEMVKNDKALNVKHHVKGKDVYVECYVPNFHFINDDEKAKNSNEGYIELSLNGEVVDNIYTAAFIVRGLPSGKHSLRIALVKNNEHRYDIEQTIEVSI